MDFEKKKTKTVLQVLEIDASCLSPEFDSSHRMRTRLVKATLVLSLTIGLALVSLHQPSGNGKPVPALIFQGYSSVFDAFVICVMFSFTGSFSWLLTGNKPKLATSSRCYFIMSMVFVALALSILACALFLENFRLVFAGSRLWNPENFKLVRN